MPRKPVDKAMDLLKEFPHLSIADIAKRLKISERTVSRARSLLKEEGWDPVKFTSTEYAEGRLTTQEALDLLSNHARLANMEGNFTQLRDAIREYFKLESTSSESSAGPGPPLNDSDKVQRASMIIDFIGPVLASQAIILAFTDEADLILFKEALQNAEAYAKATKSPQVAPGHPENPALRDASEIDIDPDRINLGDLRGEV